MSIINWLCCLILFVLIISCNKSNMISTRAGGVGKENLSDSLVKVSTIPDSCMFEFGENYKCQNTVSGSRGYYYINSSYNNETYLQLADSARYQLLPRKWIIGKSAQSFIKHYTCTVDYYTCMESLREHFNKEATVWGVVLEAGLDGPIIYIKQDTIVDIKYTSIVKKASRR